MAQPKVSVLIPFYKQEAFVRETIDSVLAQTYPDVEIIPCDDGSPDATAQILRDYAQRFPDRIKLALSGVNSGISANLNRGYRLCTGQYLALLGGDDLMLPTKFEKQVALMESRPDAVGCYHDAEVFESSTGKVLGNFSELYNGTPKLREGGIADWTRSRYQTLPSTMLFHMSACPRHGFDERLKYANDGLFLSEVFVHGNLAAIQETLVRYRRHDNNVTAGPPSRRREFFEEELMALGILQARYPQLRHDIRRWRIAYLLSEAVYCYRIGQLERHNGYIKTALTEGAGLRAAALFVGLRLFKRKVSDMTAGQPYTRPGWLKRLAGMILGGM